MGRGRLYTKCFVSAFAFASSLWVAGAFENAQALFVDADQDSHAFEIPAQPLANALEQFAAQSGYDLLFQARLIKNLHSEPVTGDRVPLDALHILLGDNDLRAELAAENVAILQKLERHTAVGSKVKKKPPKQPLYGDMILVTARRRTEVLSNHPGLASTLNREQLQMARVDGVEEITQSIANAYVEERPGSQINIFIRGAGTETSGSGARNDTGIGLYYDDAYNYIQGSRIPPLFFDIERVEVLKGPQGSLYGRNAVGGAIIVKPASPKKDFSSLLNAELGEFAYKKAQGHVNLSLSDKLSFRFSGFYSNRNSFYDNVDEAREETGEQALAFRGRLLFEPNDNLDILLGYEHWNEDKGGQILTAAQFGLSHQSVATMSGFSDRETDAIVVKVFWDGLDVVEVRSVFGYSEIGSSSNFDFNNLSQNEISGEFFVGLQQADLDAWRLSHDVYAVSKSLGPLSWLVGGGYYFDQRTRTSSILTGFPSDGVVESDSQSSLNTTMFSMYMDLTYSFSEQISINASARYSYEKREGDSTDLTVVSVSDAVASPFQVFSSSYDKLSPSISIQYRPVSNFMTYAKISTGYQSGGVNTRASSEALVAFGPSTAVNYEVGFRSQWFDRGLTLDAAVFQLDQENFQFPLDNPPYDELIDGGEAQTIGIEIEASLRPFDWIEVVAAYGYLDAKIISAPGATPGFDPGIRKFGSPRYNGTIGLNVKKPVSVLGGATLNININYEFVRDRYSEGLPIALEDYDIIDVRTGIILKSGAELYIFASNLTDDVYSITPAFGASRVISPPRLMGVGFSKSF